jgi:tripartite-type tricarboxylate transporter receptor subunit TctC
MLIVDAKARNMRLTRNLACALVIAASAHTTFAATPAYPTKPLRLIVTFAAGGTADLLGRIVGQEMSAQLGQVVVLDNRPGAGGALGADIVAKAPSDGYNLVLSNAASHGVAPSLHRKLPYDAVKDFSHIGLITVIPQFFVASKGFAPATLKAFLAEAKRAPGTIHFGTAGPGSIGHFAGELLKQTAKVDIVHIPYKGTAPATTDLIANRVQVMFQNAPEAGPHIRSGALRLLAVTSERRHPQFPDAPTMLEEGMEGFVSATWYGLSSAPGTPAEIVKVLSDALAKALAQPATKTRLTQAGFELRSSSPADYRRFIEAEVKKFKTIAERAGIKPED